MEKRDLTPAAICPPLRDIRQPPSKRAARSRPIGARRPCWCLWARRSSLPHSRSCTSGISYRSISAATGARSASCWDDAVRIVSKDLIDTNYAEEHVVSMLLFVIVLAAASPCIGERTISDRLSSGPIPYPARVD